MARKPASARCGRVARAAASKPHVRPCTAATRDRTPAPPESHRHGRATSRNSPVSRRTGQLQWPGRPLAERRRPISALLSPEPGAVSTSAAPSTAGPPPARSRGCHGRLLRRTALGRYGQAGTTKACRKQGFHVKRMKGLEPSTFCMASSDGARQFPSVQPINTGICAPGAG